MIKQLKRNLLRPTRKRILPNSRVLLVGIFWALVMSIFFPPTGFARSQNFDFDFIRSKDVPGFFAVKIYPVVNNVDLEGYFLQNISISVPGASDIFPKVIKESVPGQPLLFVGKFVHPEKLDFTMRAEDPEGVFETTSILDFDIYTESDWGWDLGDIWEYQSGEILPISDPHKIQRQKDILNLFPLILGVVGFLLILLALFLRRGRSETSIFENDLETSGQTNREEIILNQKNTHYTALDTDIPEAFWHQSKQDMGKVVDQNLEISKEKKFPSTTRQDEWVETIDSINTEKKKLEKEISQKSIEDPFWVEVVEK